MTLVWLQTSTGSMRPIAAAPISRRHRTSRRPPTCLRLCRRSSHPLQRSRSPQRLSTAMAVAAALAFVGVFVRRAGKASVRADWDAQKLGDAEARRLASTAREQRFDARQKRTDKDAHDGQAKLGLFRRRIFVALRNRFIHLAVNIAAQRLVKDGHLSIE